MIFRHSSVSAQLLKPKLSPPQKKNNKKKPTTKTPPPPSNPSHFAKSYCKAKVISTAAGRCLRFDPWNQKSCSWLYKKLLLMYKTNSHSADDKLGRPGLEPNTFPDLWTWSQHLSWHQALIQTLSWPMVLTPMLSWPLWVFQFQPLSFDPLTWSKQLSWPLDLTQTPFLIPEHDPSTFLDFCLTPGHDPNTFLDLSTWSKYISWTTPQPPRPDPIFFDLWIWPRHLCWPLTWLQCLSGLPGLVIPTPFLTHGLDPNVLTDPWGGLQHPFWLLDLTKHLTRSLDLIPLDLTPTQFLTLGLDPKTFLDSWTWPQQPSWLLEPIQTPFLTPQFDPNTFVNS